MDERLRILQAYARREREGRTVANDYLSAPNLLEVQQRERVLLRYLRRFHALPLTGRRILEVGCGDGRALRRFIDYGARPQDLYGIDLLPDKVQQAQALNPLMTVQEGNAASLPFPDACFDMVFQCAMFTSILDLDMKQRAAEEMERVLRPGGIILWYDFLVSNPRNPDVRGVGLGEIRWLFPHCKITLSRITLAPPLARAVAPLLPGLAYILQGVPFLCTHYLGAIKPGSYP